MNTKNFPTPITKKFLQNYRELISEYKELVRTKKLMHRKLGENSKDIRLERVKKQITILYSNIIPLQAHIRAEISKVAQLNYRQLLTMRHVYQWKWNFIERCFFDKEPDFEYGQGYKYHDKLMHWNRQALKCLRAMDREERTAINTVKRIMMLCNRTLKAKPTQQEQVFVNKVLKLIDVLNAP